MQITIQSILSDIKRHLAVIGKRLYSKEGKNLFSDITLSSAESTQILTQYIKASVQDIEAALKQFITATALNGSVIEITITNTRADDDFQQRTQNLAESYITLSTLAAYLAMLHHDIAQKYHADATQRMDALTEYVIYKKPPTPTAYSYADITGTITNS